MGKVSAFPFHNLLLLINMNYNRRVIRSIAELETVFDSFSPSLTERKTRDNRLERMKRLLAFLGNPEESFRTYHVAGSKGKGSTSAYLASLLTGYGRHCGLYTSPHLFTVRERFTLSGEFFADEMYINVCNKLLEKVSIQHMATCFSKKQAAQTLSSKPGWEDGWMRRTQSSLLLSFLPLSNLNTLMYSEIRLRRSRQRNRK